MRWAQWLVDHLTTVVVAVFAILVVGVQAYLSLPRESTPDITIPVVTVTTVYPGVSPADIETLVTQPMERYLKEVKDVDKLSSTSMEGASSVVLEFDPDVDIDEALPKVREKVDSAIADIPEDAEEPIVGEISFSEIPILIVTITGTEPDGQVMDEEKLKLLAEDLQEEIEDVPGVLEVQLSGGMTREISVQMDPDLMRLYELSFNDVMTGISRENVNIPGGNVDAQEADYLLRVPGEFTTMADIEGVPLKKVGGQTVFIRDVARVVDGFADRATYSRMNGTPSISLSVQKRVGENIVRIAQDTMATVASESEQWPEGVEYAFIADQSREIESMVGELENNIISGLILVVLVLVFFMGFRNSLFVGLAIPLSMLVSFGVLQLLGITLNMVVLFSLILALGMLVDNAIVVVENIYRHVEGGKPLSEASVIGVSEVAVPVATSTLTTVVAFAPMLFWSGVMGQFMGFLPKTLIIVLVSSLVVAVFIIPTMTSRLMKAVPLPEGASPSEEVIPDSGLYGWVMKRYKWILEWSIEHRYVSFFGLGIGSLVGTFVIYGMFNNGTEFMPQVDPARATVQITMPDGTRIDKTDEIARRVEQILLQEPDVDTFVTEVGVAGGGGGGLFGKSSAPHAARLTIDFKPTMGKARPGEAVREGLSMDAIERIRGLADYAVGAKIVVEKEEMGPPVGKPIDVQIRGDDFHQLGLASAVVQRELAKLASEPDADERTAWAIVDLSDDYKVGRPELALSIDRSAAKAAGTSTGAVGNDVRTAVAGAKASTLRQGDEEYDIVVELDPRYKQDLQSVLNLWVRGSDRNQKTVMVPLSTLASFEAQGGSGAIRHLDRQTLVTITGDVSGARKDLAQAAVAEFIQTYEPPPGVRLALGGSNKEEKETQEFLSRAFGAALILIFLVLVTQFNSVSRPFIIMMSVLLSLIGVLWGLLITGTPFGIMMTGVGVISLAGVVVNNAIVLLDYVQQCQEEGMEIKDALVRAGLVRFRPVVLTAITTILGLLPMATGVSVDFARFRVIAGGDSAGFWGPMAVAVSFGLAVATVLTLVMVPTMVSISEDIDGLFARLTRRATPVVPTIAKLLPFVVLPALFAYSSPAQAQVVSLNQALSAAEENNLDLKILDEQVFLTETLVPMAWSSLTPRVVAGGNWNRNQKEIPLEFDTEALIFRPSTLEPIFLAAHPDPQEQAVLGAVFDEVEAQEEEALSQMDTDPIIIQKLSYFDANISVIQPLYNPVALPGLRGSYVNRDAVRHDADRARQQLRAAVTQSYYGLVVARESQSIAADSVANATDHWAVARRQVETGAAPSIVGLQAELALARAERQLIDTEAQILAAEQAFSKLTGLSSDVMVAMPNSMTSPVQSLDQALEHVGQRADVQAADGRMQVATYQKRADQLAWLPTVDARFTQSWTQNTGFQGQSTLWMFTVSANWTMWDGGYRLQTNRQYASQVRIADYQSQKLRMEAAEEIRVAWQRYERAEQAFAAVELELSLATENLRLSEQGFAAGSTTWLQVSDAQLMLDQARIGVLSGRMNRDMAVVMLGVATGSF